MEPTIELIHEILDYYKSEFKTRSTKKWFRYQKAYKTLLLDIATIEDLLDEILSHMTILPKYLDEYGMIRQSNLDIVDEWISKMEFYKIQALKDKNKDSFEYFRRAVINGNDIFLLLV